MAAFYPRLGSPNRSALPGQSLLSSQEVNVSEGWEVYRKEPGLSLFIRLSHAFAAWDTTVKLLAGLSDQP